MSEKHGESMVDVKCGKCGGPVPPVVAGLARAGHNAYPLCNDCAMGKKTKCWLCDGHKRIRTQIGGGWIPCYLAKDHPAHSDDKAEQRGHECKPCPRCARLVCGKPVAEEPKVKDLYVESLWIGADKIPKGAMRVRDLYADRMIVIVEESRPRRRRKGR